jgi:hypothetical protein
MSQRQGWWDGFPAEIVVGGSTPVVLAQKAGFFALHGEPPPVSTQVVLRFEPERIAVLSGAPPLPLDPNQSVSPVYAAAGSDALAVPTGQLFVRLRQGVAMAAFRAALEPTGCVIAMELDHAPEAAWLRARSGSIAEALGCVARLRGLAEVENVEAQLLMQRVPR